MWIDLDHVVYDMNPVAERWFDREGLPQLDLTKWCYGYEADEFYSHYDRLASQGMLLEMSVFPGVTEMVNRLVEAGHRVNFLTSRKSFTGDTEIDLVIKSHTREVLKRDGFPESVEVVFAPAMKSDFIRENGGDVLVDDHSETCIDVAAVRATNLDGNVRVYLKDCDHNQDVGFNPRIRCVSELMEVMPELRA